MITAESKFFIELDIEYIKSHFYVIFCIITISNFQQNHVSLL